MGKLHPLAAWLKANAKPREAKPEEFVDESGVLRYKHNWQAVSEEDRIGTDGDADSYNAFLYHRGLSCVESHIPGRDGNADVVGEVLFIEDYVKIFNTASANRCDAFGRHAALFEVTALFLFDERTITCVTWALYYIICVYVILVAVDHRPIEVYNAAADVVILSCQYVGYKACCRVYKASEMSCLFDAYVPRPASAAMSWSDVGPSGGDHKAGRGSGGPMFEASHAVLHDSNGRVPMSLLLRTYFHFLFGEARSMLRCGTWQRFAAVGRRSTEAGSASATARADRQAEGGSTHQCSYYLLLNVGVSLLEKCTRFEVRMGHTGSYYVVSFFVYLVCVYLGSISLAVLNCPCIWTVHSALPDAYNCTGELVFMIMTLCNVIPAVYSVVTVMGMVVGIIGLYYGSVVVHGLATSWVERYATLRKYCPEGEGSDAMVELGGGVTLPAAALETRIRMDAHEHYLLLREYATQLSTMWSGIVLVLLVVGMVLTVFAFWAVTIYNSLALQVILVLFGIFFVVLCQLAISCFAWANGAVTNIQYALRHGSSSNDYAVLGGREAWIAYLEDSPAHWTIYGFAITWNVLYAYASSGVTAMIGIASFALSHG